MQNSHTILDSETLAKIRALYMQDLDHGPTRADKYRAADKLLALARFEQSQNRQTSKGPKSGISGPSNDPQVPWSISRPEPEELPHQITPPDTDLDLVAAQALAHIRLLEANAPIVRQLRTQYYQLEGLGAVNRADYRYLESKGLLTNGKPHTALLTAWIDKELALLETAT